MGHLFFLCWVQTKVPLAARFLKVRRGLVLRRSENYDQCPAFFTLQKLRALEAKPGRQFIRSLAR